MASGWIEQRTKKEDHHTLRIAEKDPVTGKRKVILTMTVVGPKLRAEAVLKDKLAEHRLGLLQLPTQTTVSELLKDWLNGCKARLAATTVSGYEIAIRKHINPTIGNIKLSELQPLHLQRLYTGLLDKGLSERTVEWVHTICSASLKQAVKWDLIRRNPAEAVDAPRPRKKQLAFLEQTDLAEFLDLIQTCPHGDIVTLALWTGLRRGELLALTWADIDFGRRCLHVRRNVVRVRKQTIIKEPKTSHSRRAVVLPALALALLARVRAESTNTNKDALVFTRNGKPIMPSSVTSAFNYTLKGTRFQALRLHDMRHSHASLFLKAGGHSKVLQERLGHGSHSTTMDIYAHLMPDMQRESVDRFEQMVETACENQNATRYPSNVRNADDGQPSRPA